MSNPYILIGIGLAVGAAICVAYYKARLVTAGKSAQGILDEAEKESGRLKEEYLAKARKESDKRREHLEGEIGSKRKDLESVESRLAKKEDNLDRKFDLLNKKESSSIFSNIEEIYGTSLLLSLPAGLTQMSSGDARLRRAAASMLTIYEAAAKEQQCLQQCHLPTFS